MNHLPVTLRPTPRDLGLAFSDAVADIAAAVGRAAQRSRQRHALARMAAHQLRDIGLSRADARRESSKPFWQAL